MVWKNNIITNKLNIQLPIIQAPMAGGATTAELVAAVSNSGGLGSLGAGYMQADAIRNAIRKIRTLTNKPFAVNLFVSQAHYATNEQIAHMQGIIRKACFELDLKLEKCQPPYAPLFDEQVKVIIEEKIPIFSFTFGILAKNLIAEFKKNKTILIGTATNAIEAQLLEENGIDIIVAQGSEAGGHRGTFATKPDEGLIGLMALIPQLVDKVKIPVVAAGGIMDARGIIAACALGATGVQMGSAFLTCKESGIHPQYKKALLNTFTDNTTLTKSFSGKLARGIKNTFIERMTVYENEILDYPIQNSLTQAMRKQAAVCNDIQFLPMWCGQNAYLSKSMAAKELINKLTQEVETFFLK